MGNLFSSVRNFSRISLDEIQNILSRLPLETLKDCRLVCKDWRDMIAEPTFGKLNLPHLIKLQSRKLSFLVFDRMLNFHYFDYRDGERTIINLRKTEGLFSSYHLSSLHTDTLGSYNGIVCLHCFQNDTTCILNPFLREYKFLPRIPEKYLTYTHLSCGFGYISSTEQYRIVSLYQTHANGGHIEILVYTLGSDLGWTSSGTYALEDPPWQFEQIPAVFAKGALHWRNTVNGEIVIFDLTKESLVFGQELPEFPEGVPLNNHSIGVSDGNIHYAVLEDIDTNRYQIHVIGNENYLAAQGGNVTLDWTVKLRLQEPNLFAVTQSGCALCFNGYTVLMYDPSALASLMNGAIFITSTDLARIFALRSIIPHMNSLLSLEDIGEKDATPVLSFQDKLYASSGRRKRSHPSTGSTHRNKKRY